MKKTITTFLLVAFILSFVIIAGGIVKSVLAFVGPDGFNAGEFAKGLVYISFGIFDMIVMIIVRNKWPQIKNKEEAKKIAVWSIVAGAICCVFSAVAGILMLVMPEEQYKQD